MSITKSQIVWLHTRNWCEANPDKIAVIVTPSGTFEIKFTKKMIKSEEFMSHEFDESPEWIKKYFLE